MECDKCRRDIGEYCFTVQIPDDEMNKKSLGKYCDRKMNTDMIISWHFCYECLLDALLNDSMRVPVK